MGYTGVAAKIPFGEFGLLTDLPPAEIPPSALILAENVTLENGLVEKARGGLRYNENVLPAGVAALFDWWPDSVTQRLIAACSNGSVYRDIGDRQFSGNSAIATGLGTLTPNTVFVEGGQETTGRSKKLFLFTEGLNQIKVLTADGTSFATIANPATDWTTPKFPKIGVVHRNRLWAFQGYNTYASDSADHENFTSNYLSQPIFPGEGGEIKGAYVFKGRLFAFKDGGFVYFLEDSDTDDSNWFWRKLSGNFGLASPHSVLDALNDMLAVNTTGTLTSYTATQALGDIESADMFRNAMIEQYVHTNLNKGGLSQLHSLYYPEKKQVYLTYRASSGSTNNTMIVIDLGRDKGRITTAPKGTPQCLALRKDVHRIERPIYGDASGWVVLMDREDRLEGGSAFTGTFQTSALDFRAFGQEMSSVEKHFDFLQVEFIPAGVWNLSCDYYIDGKYIETLTFPMYIDADYLTEFELDEDRMRSEHSKFVTKRLKGTGRNISFKFYQAGSNQSFQIAGITVGFRPGSDRQLRRS